MTSILPNYECAAYKRQVSLWRYLDDVFMGSEAWMSRQADGKVKPLPKAKFYLPQEVEELQENYVNRLLRSPYQERYADCIRDFVGMILTNGIRLDEVPSLMQLHWEDIDRNGMYGDAFVAEVAIAAMRRGHTFILVDTPQNTGDTLADAIAARPYWVHIHATDVINWRSHYVDGVLVLDMVVIRQRYCVPDGEYGEREEEIYLVLTPGKYVKYQIMQDGRGNQSARLVASGMHGIKRNGEVEPFPIIPLVCVYGGFCLGVFQSKPPLKHLADLNLAHYQTHSDHRNKVHKCCFPVAVRFGVMGEQEPLVLGPDTVIDAPPGGGFSWQEPDAGSLERSRQEMQDLELVMDFLSAQYLIKPEARQAAAVSLIQAAKVESSLYLFAQSLTTGINGALAIHARYLGFPYGGAIKLQTKFFQQQQNDSQLLLAYIHLHERLSQLPDEQRRSLMQVLTAKGFIPDISEVSYE